MLITGQTYRMNFADVAVRMLAVSNFLAAENVLKEMERENEIRNHNNHIDNSWDNSGHAHPVN